MGLEAAELARWTRFAAKGGIGKCIATCDCVAESSDDLMFLKDDEITVLLQLPDHEGFYLGYCEGVVGRFSGLDVNFTSKLKKPVMTKRSSSMGTIPGSTNSNKSPSPTVSRNATSPSPPPHTSVSYHTHHGSVQRISATPSPSAFRSVSVSSVNSRMRPESSERTGEWRGSVRHQASPLSTSRSLGPDREQERRQDIGDDEHTQTTFAILHEVALAEAALTGHGEQPRHGSISSRKEYHYAASPVGTPSPQDAQFRADSRSDGYDSNSHTKLSRYELDDRRSASTDRLPTHVSVSSSGSGSQPLSTSSSTSSASFAFTTAPSSSSSSPQTSPPSSPPRSHYSQPHSLQQHRYTAHAPSPLALNPDQYAEASGNFTSPLRITKRSPVPGSAQGFATNMQMQLSPPPTGSLPLLPGSPSASARTHHINTSASVSQTLTAPIYPSNQQGLSPSVSVFSGLSSPSVYSSPPHSAAPTLHSSSSSPSHTATFAHRLGLDSAHGSSASLVNDAEFTDPAIGSSPATLAQEDRDHFLDSSAFDIEQRLSDEKDQKTAENGHEVQEHPARALRDSSAAAAGVSIGLSLLEGLIGNYSDDESDDDEPGSQYSDDGDSRPSQGNGANNVNRDSFAISEEGTAEGLGYARSEESHAVPGHGQATYAQPTPIHQTEAPASPQTTHTEEHLLSPATSPTLASFSSTTQLTSRERRPSLAPSASSVQSGRSGASASTAASARTTSWEGAGDIYDDYRYSRASIRPSFDAMSVRSVGGGGERRPSFESVGSSGGYFMGMRRERVDSGASSSFGGTRLGGLVEGLEKDDKISRPVEESDPGSVQSFNRHLGDDTSSQNGDMRAPLTDSHAQRISLAHRRTESNESDASVYTQNSRLSTLSRDLALGGVLASLGVDPSAEQKGDGDGDRTGTHMRPAHLALSIPGSEPLLNTTWGSAVSSAGMSSSGIAAYTPVAGVLEVEGQGLYNSGNIDKLSNEEEALKSPTAGAGFASAMRMRLEEDRLAHVAETQANDSAARSSLYSSTGLGNRIIIEDEDELPSRIGDDTFDSQATTTETSYQDGGVDRKGSFTSHESHDTDVTAHIIPSMQADSRTDTPGSSSPEPEILGGLGLGLGSHLAPLVVVNRTPSPSLLEGASDHGRTELDESLGEDSTTSFPGSSPVIALSVPPTAPSNAPSPAPSTSPSPSHLRPSLADLREPTGAPVPGTNQRRSLFLPHPNAPKSPAGLASPGPMYIAAQQLPGPGDRRQVPQGPPAQYQRVPYPPHSQPGPPRPNVFTAIRMALSRPPQPIGPARAPHQMRGPTIYGRIDVDLAAALGPVPISFTIEPPPPGTAAGPSTMGQVQGRGLQAGATSTSPPRIQMMAKSGTLITQQKQSMLRSVSLGPGVATPPNPNLTANPSPDLPSTAAASDSSKLPTTSAPSAIPGDKLPGEPRTGPIPRANFFPKSPGLRPRSRSFSGFNSMSTEVPVPLQRSREDAEISAKDVHRSLTARASSGSLASKTSSPGQLKPGANALRPSPLSLSHLGGSGSLKPSPTSPLLKPPSSPLSQSVFVPPPQEASARQSPEISLSPPSATTNLGRSLGNSATDIVNNQSANQLREIPARSTVNDALLRSPPTLRSNSLSSEPIRTQLNSSTGSLIPNTSARSSSPHSMMDLGAGEPRTQIPPPAVVARQSSLRSKLSLPNLRRKQSRQEEEPNVTLNTNAPGGPNINPLSSPTSPINSGLSLLHDPEMLQVKDMEFELVRPNLAHHFSQAARTSEDSNVLGRDGSFDLRQENGPFLRAESPAFSTSSGAGGGSSMQLSGQRSPTTEGRWSQAAMSTSVSPPPGASRAPTDTESSMDAHRQRELKWMSLMSANPASSARKSKKVRKLVIDGVPSSVRYLVWSYLTDGKARCVPGVYMQLCARGKVSAVSRIEEDIKRAFGDADGEQLYSHLRGSQGPVGTLLSAYLNMVPDVQYTIGLTLIVGQLLILAPEEDAFWIFVSIMDTHIRPYFSPSTTQMEVDAALFSRALEHNDQQLSKKVFVDMGILPAAICQPWFSTLFVGTLPPEYLNRVWDLFLFEGVPFLIRVALALSQCCRRTILEATNDDFVLSILRRPPQSLLPPTADAFLSLAFGVKHKDDDMRKQRVKMEAQMKRQTQAPRTASTSGMISLPRT